MWQGHRLGFVAETGSFVTIDALGRIFLAFFSLLPSFLLFLRPISACFSSSCCFVRAAVTCSPSASTCSFLCHLLKKNASAVSTTYGWLKLNFASCVVRKTRSLGALVLCSICNIGVQSIYPYQVPGKRTRTNHYSSQNAYSLV